MFIAYLRLMRPANIVTAIADILAGFSVALFIHSEFYNETVEIKIVHPLHQLIFLIFATIGLYGGGVVMNDVADYELDKIERPERPIPSGFASRNGAAVFGMILLLAGILAAYNVSILSAEIAVGIAVMALIYDFFGKHSKFFGPLNMGLCRGGNLVLGMSVIVSVSHIWILAIIPVIYIAAITMISRGEVVGGNRRAILLAGLMYGVVISSLAYLQIEMKNLIPEMNGNDKFSVFGFILLFAGLIYFPLIRAFRIPQPMNIRKAVKAGVISLIVMDAALATVFQGWEYGLVVLALLPISILLARLFAVT